MTQNAVAEIDRALMDFARPSSMEDFDRSRAQLTSQERESLEQLDKERERSVGELISKALPCPIIMTDVHFSRDDRAYVYIFVSSDREGEVLTTEHSNQLKTAVYNALIQSGMFRAGRTKLKLVVDSKETVDRDYGGNFYRRIQAS